MKRAGPRAQRAAASGRRGAATLSGILASLKRLYGKPPRPLATGLFAQILYENVAYLASDARRADAFRLLSERIGLSPRSILQAPDELLCEIGRRGILPTAAAEKLRESARTAEEEFGGDLDGALRKLPLAQAKKALRRFPSIGEPGAEKILVFAGRLRALGLDSNGLRVLLRLGYGREGKSYAATYRSAEEAVAPELPSGRTALVEASQLLRRHGQELCKTNRPRCKACPVRVDCLYFRTLFTSGLEVCQIGHTSARWLTQTAKDSTGFYEESGGRRCGRR